MANSPHYNQHYADLDLIAGAPHRLDAARAQLQPSAKTHGEVPHLRTEPAQALNQENDRD